MSGRRRRWEAIGLTCLSALLVADLEVPNAESTPQKSSICDVLDHADNFQNKSVRISATYRFGFENSELYCLSCLRNEHVWVEFDSSEAGDLAAKAVRKTTHGHQTATLNGTFTGVWSRGYSVTLVRTPIGFL